MKKMLDGVCFLLFSFSFLFLFSSVFLLTSPNAIVFLSFGELKNVLWDSGFFLAQSIFPPTNATCLLVLIPCLLCVSTVAPKHMHFLLTTCHSLNDAWFLACVWCCNSTCTHTHCASISVLLMCQTTISHFSILLFHSHRNDVVLSQLMDADDACM